MGVKFVGAIKYFSLIVKISIYYKSQTTVMKSQQERIESNNALADRLRSQLSQTEEKLAALQGKE